MIKGVIYKEREREREREKKRDQFCYSISNLSPLLHFQEIRQYLKRRLDNHQDPLYLNYLNPCIYHTTTDNVYQIFSDNARQLVRVVYYFFLNLYFRLFEIPALYYFYICV